MEGRASGKLSEDQTDLKNRPGGPDVKHKARKFELRTSTQIWAPSSIRWDPALYSTLELSRGFIPQKALAVACLICFMLKAANAAWTSRATSFFFFHALVSSLVRCRRQISDSATHLRAVCWLLSPFVSPRAICLCTGLPNCQPGRWCLRLDGWRARTMTSDVQARSVALLGITYISKTGGIQSTGASQNNGTAEG